MVLPQALSCTKKAETARATGGHARRRVSPDQRSILRETQALSPAEFNADRPAATVTRHVNGARQPVNRAALKRLVIGTVLDQGVDAGIFANGARTRLAQRTLSARPL